MPKQNAYTVRKKLELITRIRNGESQAKVAHETSIAESTLRGWLKSEVALRQYADGLQGEDGLKRKKQRTAKDPVLDIAMVNWFAQERQTGLPISGPVVKAHAEIFNKWRDWVRGEPGVAMAMAEAWLHHETQDRRRKTFRREGRHCPVPALTAEIPRWQPTCRWASLQRRRIRAVLQNATQLHACAEERHHEKWRLQAGEGARHASVLREPDRHAYDEAVLHREVCKAPMLQPC